MRTTIDVPDELLDELMRLCGIRKKKEAVRLALEEFVRRRKTEQLLALPGTIEVADVTAELEEMELAEFSRAD